MSNSKVFQIMGGNLEQIKKARQICQQPNGNKISYNPFFTSVLVYDFQNYGLEVSNGNVIHYDTPKKVSPYLGRIELRMGHPKKGGSVEWNVFTLPGKLDKQDSKRRILDTATDLFWGCAGDFEERYANSIGRNNNRERYIYFSKEAPVRYIQREKSLDINLEELAENFEKVTRKLKNSKMDRVDIDFDAKKEIKYLMNSEGSKIFTNFISYRISLRAETVDERRLLIPHSKVWYGNESSQVPDYNALMKMGYQVTRELEEIVKAPIQTNGAFPAIIDGENAGVLFHEAIGHGLEGHRMQEQENYWGEEESISLFKDKIGDKVAPEFISLYDDPTIEFFNKIPVNGYYLYDEDCVKGQKVHLVERGILKDYLHSRQSAGYFNRQSNGHCRAGTVNSPCVRMGNLFVKSSNQISLPKLKEELIKECIKQRKPYGLLLKGTTGGVVLPEESFYNTSPANVFRVHLDGKEERVKGIYIVGTPHQTLMNILQTSDNYGVFNGYCGAESGYVKSSEIAPDVLIRSLEVNRIPKSSYSEMANPIF